MSKIDPRVERLNSIPIIHTRGTYYEVGFHVGRTFRGVIEDFLINFGVLHNELLPALNTAAGKKAYDDTLRSLEENFPHLVRELRGTADGARVPFHELMLLHMDLIVPKNSGMKSTPSFGCSSVCSNYDNQIWLGHTEDALPETLNHLYIVSAHIEESEPQGKWKTREEVYTALCYAGHLPGFCMGFNHHGLIYSINVIFPKTVLAGKTPRHFLTRALLAAESEQQVKSILRDEGVGSADGFSVNMMMIKKDEKDVFQNIEVGPAENEAASPLSIFTIVPGESFVHTNSYLRLQIEEDTEIEGKSSTRRLSAARKCFPVNSREVLLSLVSSDEDQQYPIFREGEGIDQIKTICVGVFNITERKWEIFMKNPSKSKPLVTIPITFK